jgi:hypothetical protein
VNVPVSMLEAQRESVGKSELEGWLLGSWEPPLSDGARSRRFILAVLRDLYINDFDVQAWLTTPREELGGATARELMTSKRVADVEALVIRRWNQG